MITKLPNDLMGFGGFVIVHVLILGIYTIGQSFCSKCRSEEKSGVF